MIHPTSRRLCLISVILLLLAAASCVPVPTPSTDASGQATPSVYLSIYAPATPASIPILLAARNLEGAQVTIFSNHTQANAQFLRGDVDVLVTGLSVGVDLFRNGAPVQVINSYVAGMTYLVTHGKKADHFADLKGGSIYIPFEGSPIEETTRYFVEREGLAWKKDITPIYAPFASSVELLKQGKVTAVALPEPSVSLIAGAPDLHISLSYRELWDAATGSNHGYPQVTPFVRRDWATANEALIARLNDEIATALTYIAENPSLAVAQTKDALGLPEPLLLAAIGRTDFSLVYGEPLKDEVTNYYRTIGEPLEAAFDAFFYGDPQ